MVSFNLLMVNNIYQYYLGQTHINFTFIQQHGSRCGSSACTIFWRVIPSRIEDDSWRMLEAMSIRLELVCIRWYIILIATIHHRVGVNHDRRYFSLLPAKELDLLTSTVKTPSSVIANVWSSMVTRVVISAAIDCQLMPGMLLPSGSHNKVSITATVWPIDDNNDDKEDGKW